jgi:8-oxo-dGTP pyrophosphatase MutT (NUDIX family)
MNDIPTYEQIINLHAKLGNLERPRTALIVLRDQEGNYLLGAKPNLYPEKIFRFIGGGIDPDENFEEGAIREIQEELQIKIIPNQLTALADIITTGILNGQNSTNTTRLYELKINNIEQVTPGDDITYLQTLNRPEMNQLIQRYKELSDDNWFQTPNGRGHSWGDYGKMYAYIHQIALDLTT